MLWEVNQKRWPVHPMAIITEAGFTPVMLLNFAMDWVTGTDLMDSLL